MNNTEQMIKGVSPEALEQRYKQLVMASKKLEFAITDDIKNIHGALLVRSGISITAATCDKLMNHKLQRPLDAYLQFSNQVTEKNLVQDVVQLAAETLIGTRIDFDDVVKTVGEIVKGLEYDQSILNKL